MLSQGQLKDLLAHTAELPVISERVGRALDLCKVEGGGKFCTDPGEEETL